MSRRETDRNAATATATVHNDRDITMDSVGREIIRLYGEILESSCRDAQKAIQAGASLCWVKEQLEHGQFTKWLARHGINPRQAQRDMRLARKAVTPDHHIHEEYRGVSLTEAYIMAGAVSQPAPSASSDIEQARRGRKERERIVDETARLDSRLQDIFQGVDIDAEIREFVAKTFRARCQVNTMLQMRARDSDSHKRFARWWGQKTRRKTVGVTWVVAVDLVGDKPEPKTQREGSKR